MSGDRPQKGVDYQLVPPPSDSLRQWAMTVTGISLLVIALVVLIDATFDVFTRNEERPFEEIAFLFTTGVAFMWFGSSRKVDPRDIDIQHKTIKESEK